MVVSLLKKGNIYKEICTRERENIYKRKTRYINTHTHTHIYIYENIYEKENIGKGKGALTIHVVIYTKLSSQLLQWGTHVNPWLIHVNVWQKPLQYCKVISLQLIIIIIILKKTCLFQNGEEHHLNLLRHFIDILVLIQSEHYLYNLGRIFTFIFYLQNWVWQGGALNYAISKEEGKDACIYWVLSIYRALCYMHPHVFEALGVDVSVILYCQSATICNTTKKQNIFVNNCWHLMAIS